MNEYIDIYCERLEPGLWAEPLNALTNAAFFVAAFFAWKLARSENALDWRTTTLIIFTLIIGAGSTLFHTFATHWAMLADVLPILFFQIVFIAAYSRKVIGLNAPFCAGVLVTFFVGIYAVRFAPPGLFNGSIQYAPALIFVAGLGVWHVFNAGRERFGLLAAAALFIASLTLRSIDSATCEAFPRGTHIFWHLLNGGVLYLSMRAYILNARR